MAYPPHTLKESVSGLRIGSAEPAARTLSAWDVSLVIPMFNEEAGIAGTLERASVTLERLCRLWEIVVVDDGSTDACAKIVKEQASGNTHIRLVQRHTNQGLGRTLVDGFRAARYDTIVYSDADWPCDLAVLEKALPLLKSTDIVAGYRTHRFEGLRRWAYSGVYNALVGGVFGLRVKDVNFSFKVFKRSILRSVSLESSGSFIDAELLVSASRKGFHISQFPVEYIPRRTGRSTLSRASIIFQILHEMAVYWRTHIWGQFCERRTWRRKVFARYGQVSLPDRFHLWGRSVTCPFHAVERVFPERGTALDYGCGHGFFSHLLALKHPERRVIGYDPDARKIRLARSSINGDRNVSFCFRDPLFRNDVSFDAIALVDVLPYLSAFESRKILKRCHEKLTPGGILVVKDVARRPFWKYVCLLLQEVLAIRVFGWTWTQRKQFSVWTHTRFRKLFEETGFHAECESLSRRSVYPHVLWRATKKLPGVSVARTDTSGKRLMVTADDLGLCESVNQGIFDAVENGIVTSVSVMANGRSFDQAARKLRSYPHLSVGVHLTFIEEKPLLGPYRLNDLLAHTGRFHATRLPLLAALMTRRDAIRQIELEARAQIERVLSAGLEPVHLNSHQHIHLFPPLWKLSLRLAREYHIPRVRGLEGAWRGHEGVYGKKHFYARRMLVGGGCLMEWWNRQTTGSVYSGARILGVIESGHLNEDVLIRLLKQVPRGASELICHPGIMSAELISDYGAWGYHWAQELAALTSPRVCHLVQREKIQLTPVCRAVPS